jgi:hypothetical protein
MSRDWWRLPLQHHERRHQRASRIHPRGMGEALPHQASAIIDL